MKTVHIAPVLAAFALVAACSGSANDSQVQSSGAAAGQGATGQGATGQGATGQGGANNVGVGAGGLSLNPNTGGSSASGGIVDAGVVTPDSACAQSTSTATLASLTMLVMMDDSGSMRMNNKWTQASAAMKAFFADPAAAGVRVGLRLFPSDQPTVGCSQTVCDQDLPGVLTSPAAITACSTALVDIAELSAAAAPADAQEARLIAAIPAAPQRGNGGGTPSYAALQGAENIAIAYAATHPTETVVVVFVTDGQPNGCDPDAGHIAAIASSALAANKIKTYAVGLLGSNQMFMDGIATAGGTAPAIMIGGATGATTEAELLAAFGNIKSMNAACDFVVPPPPANLMLSFDNVNVNYTTGTGAASTLPRVQDANACGTTGGWYYDNNAAPTQIHLCMNTCATVQADTQADLKVLFSCGESQGYVPPPK